MQKILSLCLIIVVTLTFSAVTFADVKEVISTGEYVMGDLDSKRDAKKLALLEAKQMALEQAGTYLSSLSEVKDFQLTKDEISSLAAGVISVEVLEEKWTMAGENFKVTITIRAKINTDQLEEQIEASKKDHGSVEDFNTLQAEIAALKQELEELKKKESLEGDKEQEGLVSEDELVQERVAKLQKIALLQTLEKANLDLRQNNLPEAVSGFSRVLSVEPENLQALLNRALAFEKMGLLSAAKNDLDKALKLAPNSWRAHAQRGNIFQKQGKQEAALKSYNRAIVLKSSCARCYLKRGNVHLKLRQTTKAFRDYEKACNLGLKDGCVKARKLADETRAGGRKPSGRKPVRRRPN